MTRKMKDSGIEWIGMIPEGWNVGRVKHYYHIVLGKMLQPNSKSETDELLPYMCAVNITWKGVDIATTKSMWFSKEERKNYKLHKGDLLVTEGGDVAVSCIWNDEIDDCYIQNAVHRVRPKVHGCNRFLYYWMTVLKKYGYIDMVCNKATLAHFTKEKLEECIYIAPSQSEQIRIADYLDAKCAEIDALIAAQKKSNTLLKEYRQSIIFEAVTKGLDPNVPMKDSGIEWIGMIPEGWGLERLKYHAVLNPNIVLPSLSDDSDVTFIPMDHLKKGYHMKSTTTYEKVKKGYVIFENNDILMAKVTPCLENGNLAIASQLINGIGFGSTEINVIRCKCIENKYLYYLLQCDGYINKATYEMYGVAGLKRLDPSFIPNSLIPIPPQSDQQRIVSFLDAKCAEIDVLIEANEKTINQLKEYRQSVIFEAVTGKMEV